MKSLKTHSQLGSPASAFGSPENALASSRDAIPNNNNNNTKRVNDCLVRAMSRSYREQEEAMAKQRQSASASPRSPAALGPPPGRSPPSMTSSRQQAPAQQPPPLPASGAPVVSPTKGSPSYLGRQNTRSNGSTPMPAGAHVRRNNPYARNDDSLIMSRDDLSAAGVTTRDAMMLPAAHQHFAPPNEEGAHDFDDIQSHDGDNESSPSGVSHHATQPRRNPTVGVSPARSALASGRGSKPGSHPHFGRPEADSPHSEQESSGASPTNAIKNFGNAVHQQRSRSQPEDSGHGPSVSSHSTAIPPHMDTTASARSTLPFESQHMASIEGNAPVNLASKQPPPAEMADIAPYALLASQLNRQHLGMHNSKTAEPSPTSTHAPRTWDPLPITAKQLENILKSGDIDAACPPGFTFTVYNGDISRHFSISSEDVRVTRGAIKYVDHHARYGAQMRFRFQLCHNYLQNKCAKGAECSYIHAARLTQPSQVHLNPFAPRRLAADRHGHGDEVPASIQDDPAVVEQYETLPAGYTLFIHPPNAAHSTTQGLSGERVPLRPQRIPSEMIIWTRGADMALKHAMSAAQGRAAHHDATSVPLGATGGRPRHCAHYQFKRLCNLGRDCQFIHAKIPFAEAAAAAAAAAVPQTHTPAPRGSALSHPVSGQFGQQHLPPQQTLQQQRVRLGNPQQQQQQHAPNPTLLQRQSQHRGSLPPPPPSAPTAPASPDDNGFMAGVQYAVSLLAMQQQMQAAARSGHEAPHAAVPTAPLSLPNTPPTVSVPPELWAIAVQQYHHNAAMLNAAAYTQQHPHHAAVAMTMPGPTAYVAQPPPFPPAVQPLSHYLPAQPHHHHH